MGIVQCIKALRGMSFLSYSKFPMLLAILKRCSLLLPFFFSQIDLSQEVVIYDVRRRRCCRRTSCNRPRSFLMSRRGERERVCEHCLFESHQPTISCGLGCRESVPLLFPHQATTTTNDASLEASTCDWAAAAKRDPTDDERERERRKLVREFFFCS